MIRNGCAERVRRWFDKFVAQRRTLTSELLLKLFDLSAGGAIGIPSVAVECVDIRRNASGEGGLLDCN